MSNDFTPINPTDNEAPMFAGVPSWERGKKRRGLGARTSRVAAEPRSFAPEYTAEPGDSIPTRPVTLSEDARAYEARMDAVDPTDTTFASGATFADRTSRKGNGAATIMVAAGIILVGGLAAGGWYAMQPHNSGVAELTPGQATTTTTTQVAQTAPLPGEPQTTEAPAAAARSTATVTTTTHAPKATVSHTTVARAAPARSAAASGANATAAAPMPMPAPAAPPAAAAPAPLVLTLPPQAAPATSAPAEAPLPTQSAPAPAPTQTPPN